MISPFEVYLIFQLDAIRDTALTVTVIAGLAGAGFASVGSMCASAGEITWRTYKRCMTGVSIIFAGALLTSTVLPSSRSAAAIILIPAIANNEAIQTEANEMYTLAKEGLRSLVDTKGKQQEPQP
ncbi:MAG TPA: hypothetical protein PKZ27_03055 [Rhodocyclaceae bacterium]|nr:hypothetical protein [Burkholderiaceae bacterium]HRP74545.1 hypothetical protein [Rhodocyclaceae bacterium]